MALLYSISCEMILFDISGIRKKENSQENEI